MLQLNLIAFFTLSIHSALCGTEYEDYREYCLYFSQSIEGTYDEGSSQNAVEINIVSEHPLSRILDTAPIFRIEVIAPDFRTGQISSSILYLTYIDS